MCYKQWVTRMKEVLSQVEIIGGEVAVLTIKEPAALHAIEKVEEELEIVIPFSYRKTLLEFSSHMEWRWYLPDEITLPEKFEDLLGSCGILGVDHTLKCENLRRELVAEIFNDPSHPYDIIWHNKLAFFDVGNGDLLAFDLEQDKLDPPVIYLSHDDGETHGFILGENFIDFMNKWSKIGFVGGDGWSLLPFIESQNGTINPEGKNAQEWRGILGIEI